MKEEKDQKSTATIIGHYVIGKDLGKGTFGKVKQATHTLTGQKVTLSQQLLKVAVKILEKTKIKDKKDVERITREIKILKKVRHPNVIQLYEIIETETELYLITEYAGGGELFEYIVSKQRLNEAEASRLFQQLMSAVEYIHASGICHRDLKPENVLLDFDKSLKLVDFGLSNMYEDDQLLKTACGSPCYAAPEMIAGKKYRGLKSDIWSSGVVLFAMVCGHLPFEDPHTKNLYKKILSADYKLPKFVSHEFKMFLSRVLDTNPDTRISISEMKQEKWFKQGVPQFQKGLFPLDEKMPFEQTIFKTLLEQFHFDEEYAIKCIEANRHNHITTTYHLLSKKDKRQIQLKDFKSESKTPQIKGPLLPRPVTNYGETKCKDETISEINPNVGIRNHRLEPEPEDSKNYSPSPDRIPFVQNLKNDFYQPNFAQTAFNFNPKQGIQASSNSQTTDATTNQSTAGHSNIMHRRLKSIPVPTNTGTPFNQAPKNLPTVVGQKQAWRSIDGHSQERTPSTMMNKTSIDFHGKVKTGGPVSENFSPAGFVVQPKAVLAQRADPRQKTQLFTQVATRGSNSSAQKRVKAQSIDAGYQKGVSLNTSYGMRAPQIASPAEFLSFSKQRGFRSTQNKFRDTNPTQLDGSIQGTTIPLTSHSHVRGESQKVQQKPVIKSSLNRYSFMDQTRQGSPKATLNLSELYNQYTKKAKNPFNQTMLNMYVQKQTKSNQQAGRFSTSHGRKTVSPIRANAATNL